MFDWVQNTSLGTDVFFHNISTIALVTSVTIQNTVGLPVDKIYPIYQSIKSCWDKFLENYYTHNCRVMVLSVTILSSEQPKKFSLLLQIFSASADVKIHIKGHF